MIDKNSPMLVIKMTDGRIALGQKFRYRGRVRYWGSGYSSKGDTFWRDDITKEEVVKAVPFESFEFSE